MNHATLDDEAVKAIKELKTFARNSKGLGEKVETSKNKIMKTIDNNLGTSTKSNLFGGGGASKIDFQTSTKINFEVQKQVTKYFKDYIKEKQQIAFKFTNTKNGRAIYNSSFRSKQYRRF